jgi:hypothetical protein
MMRRMAAPVLRYSGPLNVDENARLPAQSARGFRDIE